MIFLCIFAISNTVRLVQLVEHQIVVLGVVGSSPTSHPVKEDRSFIGLLFVIAFSVSLKDVPESARQSRRSCIL